MRCVRARQVAQSGEVDASEITIVGQAVQPVADIGKRVRLQPKNKSMQPIYTDADNVEIQGKVIGLRRLHP